jgi:polar amino acid transport system substrate-binding protein
MKKPKLRSWIAGAGMVAALAGSAGLPAASADSVVVPNFWDSRESLARPDLSALPRLRFLTTTDFPPFNFIDREKRLTGFNVELARAICRELQIVARCQIQAIPFEEIETALARGEGDAVVAGIAITSENRTKYEFSRPYLRIPSRFASRRDTEIGEPIHLAVARHTTGLVDGSVQRDWFAQAFAKAKYASYPTRQAAFEALKSGEVDLLFLDAVSLSYWLQSEASESCCAYAGGPYFTSPQYGDAMAIAFAKGQNALATATDYALKEISDSGRFAEIYLRYFPMGLY